MRNLKKQKNKKKYEKLVTKNDSSINKVIGLSEIALVIIIFTSFSLLGKNNLSIKVCNNKNKRNFVTNLLLRVPVPVAVT